MAAPEALRLSCRNAGTVTVTVTASVGIQQTATVAGVGGDNTSALGLR